MLKDLTVPLLSGTLIISVIFNIVLAKRLIESSKDQFEGFPNFWKVDEEEEISDEEVNNVLIPILEQIQREEDERKKKKQDRRRLAGKEDQVIWRRLKYLKRRKP